MLKRENGRRDDTQLFIVILTDGESNERAEETIPMATKLRMQAHIIVVAIGTSLNMLEIRGKW